jgi:hypothetical protein
MEVAASSSKYSRSCWKFKLEVHFGADDCNGNAVDLFCHPELVFVLHTHTHTLMGMLLTSSVTLS